MKNLLIKNLSIYATTKTNANGRQTEGHVVCLDSLGNETAFTLTAKQLNQLCGQHGINIDTMNPRRSWGVLQSLVGVLRSSALIRETSYKAGDTYVDRDGVIVTRTADGINMQVDAIRLAESVEEKLDVSAVAERQKLWSARPLEVPKLSFGTDSGIGEDSDSATPTASASETSASK